MEIAASTPVIGQGRGDADDHARPLDQHLPDGQLRDMHEAEQVDRDERVNVVRGVFRERPGAVDPGVVHQDVDGAESVGGRSNDLGGGLLLADVAVDQQQARRWAQPSGHIARGRDDVVALAEKPLDEAGADSLRRSCDDCGRHARLGFPSMFIHLVCRKPATPLSMRRGRMVCSDPGASRCAGEPPAAN
jgi:hypothetical protein